MSKQLLTIASDGTPKGTSVTLDGNLLPGVTRIEVQPISIDSLISVKLTTYLDKFELTGEVVHVYVFDPQPAETKRLAPEPGSLWKHRNGGVYEVQFLTNVTDEPDARYPLTVVYTGTANGKQWSRVAADWHRSFTRLK